MKYADIYKFDISNGPGIRVSLFVQGCPFHCKGCFNPETWDFHKGKEFTKDTLNYLLDLCSPDYISGLSILGGEPLASTNISTVNEICARFKEKYPDKDIWIWTGFTMEVLNYYTTSIPNPLKTEYRYLLYGNSLTDADKFEEEVYNSKVSVIIDGQFEEDKKDLSLLWRGSSNQRLWIRNKESGEWFVK